MHSEFPPIHSELTSGKDCSVCVDLLSATITQAKSGCQLWIYVRDCAFDFKWRVYRGQPKKLAVMSTDMDKRSSCRPAIPEKQQ
eukprot:m.185529 g.185529  ORF g.185529 m.185529 type:complete len:84 (+) comp15030_c0_seq2:2121-2372(+)